MKKIIVLLGMLTLTGVVFAGNAPVDAAEKAETALNAQIEKFQRNFPCASKDGKTYHRCLQKELIPMRKNYYALRAGNEKKAGYIGSILHSLDWKDPSGNHEWVYNYITKYEEHITLAENPKLNLYGPGFFAAAKKWSQFAQDLSCDHNPFEYGCK